MRLVAICLWLFVAIVLQGGSCLARKDVSIPVASTADQLEAMIARFEAQDRTNPPQKNAILFVGSSSIAAWKTLQNDFYELPILQRGLSGSGMSDILQCMDRIVIPYAPRHIVLYAGENDLATQGAAKRTPEQVFTDFKKFVARVRQSLPAKTRISYISMKPSPARWALRDEFQKTNHLIRDWIASGAAGNADFIDIWTVMLGPGGEPRPELYKLDNLHLMPDGYRQWVEVIRPVLQKGKP